MHPPASVGYLVELEVESLKCLSQVFAVHAIEFSKLNAVSDACCTIPATCNLWKRNVPHQLQRHHNCLLDSLRQLKKSLKWLSIIHRLFAHTHPVISWYLWSLRIPSLPSPLLPLASSCNFPAPSGIFTRLKKNRKFGSSPWVKLSCILIWLDIYII